MSSQTRRSTGFCRCRTIGWCTLSAALRLASDAYTALRHVMFCRDLRLNDVACDDCANKWLQSRHPTITHSDCAAFSAPNCGKWSAFCDISLVPFIFRLRSAPLELIGWVCSKRTDVWRWQLLWFMALVWRVFASCDLIESRDFSDKPLVNVSKKEITLNASQGFEVQCEVSGDPKATVVWNATQLHSNYTVSNEVRIRAHGSAVSARA